MGFCKDCIDAAIDLPTLYSGAVPSGRTILDRRCANAAELQCDYCIESGLATGDVVPHAM